MSSCSDPTTLMSRMDSTLPTSAKTYVGTMPPKILAGGPSTDYPFGGTAHSVEFLVNGKLYFERLAETLRQACGSIFIIGWDFNPDIMLEPGRSTETLGNLLRSAVEANPTLDVRILVWSMVPIYSQKSLRSFYRTDFPAHPRIKLRFASHKHWYASHHQKLVCVDDDVAFIGGIDLTSRRFDDRRHAPCDPRRQDPDGKPHDPLHDVQAMVTGEAAWQIGRIARRRWTHSSGQEETLPYVASQGRQLSSRSVSINNIPARFALTERGMGIGGGTRDGIRMTLEIIKDARHSLYIETQYLASQTIAKALAARLSELDGPEIVIICTRSSHGFIEQLVMGRNRRRVIRCLKQADRHDRLRVFYPSVPGVEGEAEVLVHSKLLIADDAIVRIGSSNLNHRSEWLDTECDMRLDATTPDHLEAIANLRNRLLAEHLGTSAATVADQMRQLGSMINTIEALNGGPRCLRALDTDIGPGRLEPVIGTLLFDPQAPALS